MTIERQSQTGLILPGVFRGQPTLTALTQTAERPLNATARELEAFVDRLRPETAPVAWIPWLFWALGGEDYYRPDWSETKARLVLSRLIELYRSRGTVDGLGLHWRLLADATMVRAAHPPAMTFLIPSLTPSEREAVESRYPEIRVRPFALSGLRVSAMLGEPIGRLCVAVTEAADRVGNSVRLYDPATAIERELSHVTAGPTGGAVVRFGLPGAAAGIMLGRCLTGAMVDQQAGARLHTIALQAGAGVDDPVLRQAVIGRPGLIPLHVVPTHHAEPGSWNGRGAFLRNRYPDQYPDRGGSMLPAVPVRRQAARRIWTSVRLFDPAMAVSVVRRPSLHLGAARLGRLAPHTMELSVHAPGRRPRLAIWPDAGAASGGYLAVSDAGARLGRIRWAGGLARRAGGRVVIATRTRVPLLAGTVLTGTTYTSTYQEVV